MVTLNKLKQNNLLFYFLILLTFINIFAFLSEEVIAENKKSKIAVGIPPIKAFVEAVGGNKVESVVMIPPGYSPSNYAPSPTEMLKISEAEIYFTFEMPAEKSNILKKIYNFNENISVVKLNQKVLEEYEARKFSSGGTDPHLWMSVKRVKYMVELIRDKLIALDEENEDYYKKRSEDYLNKLNDLNEEIANRLKPYKGEAIIIYHPVLGYFADEYGLNMVAIEKNGKKATPKRLKEIIDLGKESNIKCIFYQATVDSKQTEVIASEINANIVEINPLSENYIEYMREISIKIVDSFNE